MNTGRPMIGNIRAGKDRRGLRSHVEATKSVRSISRYSYKGFDYEQQIMDSPRGPVARILATDGSHVGDVILKSKDYKLRRAEKRAVQGRIIRFLKKRDRATSKPQSTSAAGPE